MSMTRQAVVHVVEVYRRSLWVSSSEIGVVTVGALAHWAGGIHPVTVEGKGSSGCNGAVEKKAADLPSSIPWRDLDGSAAIRPAGIITDPWTRSGGWVRKYAANGARHRKHIPTPCLGTCIVHFLDHPLSSVLELCHSFRLCDATSLVSSKSRGSFSGSLCSVTLHVEPRIDMGSNICTTRASQDTPSRRVEVVVAGGSYAGLSAALNLLDLCDGRPARCGPRPSPDAEEAPSAPAEPLNVRVTIVDERDGYCTSHLVFEPE